MPHVRIMSALTTLFCLPSLAAADIRRVELKADTWIDLPSLRIPEERTLVLLFFTGLQERELKRLVPKLNKLNKHRDILVIGLCTASEERARKLREESGIRFPVGARSPTYRDFKIKRFPLVVVLEGSRDRRIKRLRDVAALDHWSLDWELEDYVPLQGRAFDERAATSTLRWHALQNEDSEEQYRALKLLRDKVPADEFVRVCDEMLVNTHTPRERGRIAYQRHLADTNARDKQLIFPPSIQSLHEWRRSPNDPKWDAARTYLDGIAFRTAEQLHSDFFDHMKAGPNNLLIRREIVRHLDRIVSDDPNEKVAVRAYLMEMLRSEQDAGIRQRIVGGFSQACGPGDFECADFLEGQLETESDVRLVRPMLHYTIRYLRTGEE